MASGGNLVLHKQSQWANASHQPQNRVCPAEREPEWRQSGIRTSSDMCSALPSLIIHYLLFTLFFTAAGCKSWKPAAVGAFGCPTRWTFPPLKAFSGCIYGVHMMYKLLMCWPINSSQSKRLVVGNELINLRRSWWRPGRRFHSVSVCFTLDCTHDWRANSKDFNHYGRSSCSVIFFCTFPIKRTDERSLFRA